MNREIEFRALTSTTKGNKWVYGYPYKVKSLFDETNFNWYIRNNHIIESIVDENTLGQYTGLKDCNGVKIFEGDILREYSNDIEDWVISYEYGKFVGTCDNVCEDLYELSDLEIIGNIYENDLESKGE